MLRSLRHRISRAQVQVTVVGFIALGAAASAAPAASANSFVDTTPGARTFTVPAGVHSLTIRATAGSGGNVINSYSGSTLVAGGPGALITGTVAVSPGQQLQLTVATNGRNADVTTGTSGAGGAPDGGAGGYDAGGGGGATRVLSCTGVICPIAVVAAGGGGAGANGYIANSSFTTLPGGAGGTAGARGADGTSDLVTGGSGGEPGTSDGAGKGGSGGSGGGSGSDAGDDGSGSAGGAGGNQGGTIAYGEGGGGGGGGVFGGGGGGSGANGMSAMAEQEYAGGGGGGGGSSLAPSGSAVQAAAPHAAPGVVLTWRPPPAPALSGLTRSPEAFVATSSGPSAIPANGGPGTKVAYKLNVAASVRFTVLRAQPGRKAKGGRCVKPTKANRKAHRCTRLVAVPGSFTQPGRAGSNSFRFTGRISGRKLQPGKYRLVATPSANRKIGRSASVSFRIVS